MVIPQLVRQHWTIELFCILSCNGQFGSFGKNKMFKIQYILKKPFFMQFLVLSALIRGRNQWFLTLCCVWRAVQPPLMLCLQTMQLAMQLPPPPARLPLFSYCSWSPSPSIRLQTNKQKKRGNFILFTSSTLSVYSHLVRLLLDNFVSQKIIKIRIRNAVRKKNGIMGLWNPCYQKKLGLFFILGPWEHFWSSPWNHHFGW